MHAVGVIALSLRDVAWHPSDRLVEQVHAVLRKALQAAVREEVLQRNVAKLQRVGGVQQAVTPKTRRSHRTVPLIEICSEGLRSHKRQQAKERLLG
ncbi:hypothetical protein AB0F43_09935 [Kribbella sp. NPDC023972]|uniref:hypothetical protein n=1 Tax=Kribbella sp. NPDC023972 TaxID=3154795 RepID=UPI003408166A